MSLCLNPYCHNPKASINQGKTFCGHCGSDLLINGCYRVVKLIGEGGFAKTYEVLEGSQPKVLKALLPSHTSNKKAVELFDQEANILSRLNHTGIPKVTSSCFTFLPNGNQQVPIHCFVMEKIEGVDLETWIENCQGTVISVNLVFDWLRQLIEILDLIHKNHYFHRDIKPSNVMIRPDGQLVLIDFGAAREMTNTYMAKMVRGSILTSIGSPGYIPPEQANGKGVIQSDFFSLGRTFVYILTGESPSNFPESPTTGQMIWHSSTKNIPSLLLEFIDQLMSPFVGNRPKNSQEILLKLKQIDIEIQKTIPVTKQILSVPQPKNHLSFKHIFWAVPLTSLAVIGNLFFNLEVEQSVKPIQVIKLKPDDRYIQISKTPTKLPVINPESNQKSIDPKPSNKPSVNQEQENSKLVKENERQQELLRREQERIAIEEEKKIALQKQYEQENQSTPPMKEVTKSVYKDAKLSSTPVTIEQVREQPISQSNVKEPWDEPPQKSQVDKIVDVIRETPK